MHSGDQVQFINTGREYKADEIGVLKMDMVPRQVLHCGDVGYIVSGIKTATEVIPSLRPTIHASRPSQASRR